MVIVLRRSNVASGSCFVIWIAQKIGGRGRQTSRGAVGGRRTHRWERRGGRSTRPAEIRKMLPCLLSVICLYQLLASSLALREVDFSGSSVPSTQPSAPSKGPNPVLRQRTGFTLN